MWPDRVSNPGPPTYESGALPIALRGPALIRWKIKGEKQDWVSRANLPLQRLKMSNVSYVSAMNGEGRNMYTKAIQSFFYLSDDKRSSLFLFFLPVSFVPYIP